MYSQHVDTENIVRLNVNTVNTRCFGMNDDKNQYHHGDVPSALMQAALLRIKNEGVDKLSLRALARDIGVSQTAPYRHFKDKNHLLVVLACNGFRELALRKPRLYETRDLFTSFTEAGMEYVYFAKEHPEQYRLMFGSKIENRSEHSELMTAGAAAFQVILDYTQQGVETGVFIEKEPEILAKSVWTTVHGIASLTIDDFFDKLPGEFDVFIREQLTLCIRGFAKHPKPLDEYLSH